MYGQLIVLNKHTGVRPVGVGEIWMRLVDKCVLKVFGQEVKEACSTEKMCGGMVAGFEDGIHAMRLLCQEKSK